MLILTRRPGENLVIERADGRTVRMRIRSLGGQQISIGIKAPAELAIALEAIADQPEFARGQGRVGD